jgi:hypothetical protein
MTSQTQINGLKTQKSILNHKSTMHLGPCTHYKLINMQHNEKYGVDYSVLISTTFEY